MVETMMQARIMEIREQAQAKVSLTMNEAEKLMQAATEVLAEAQAKETHNSQLQRQIKALKDNIRQLQTKLNDRDKQLAKANKELHKTRAEILMQNSCCVELI